jgi:hypothetical protein
MTFTEEARLGHDHPDSTKSRQHRITIVQAQRRLDAARFQDACAAIKAGLQQNTLPRLQLLMTAVVIALESSANFQIGCGIYHLTNQARELLDAVNGEVEA